MIFRVAGFFLFWVALPLGALALAFAFQAGVMAVCLYALFLVLAAARLMTRLWMQPLRCERELSADVIAPGEHVKVVVKLINPNPWPILWLYAEETLPKKMPKDGTTRRLLFLPPRRNFYLHYRVTPPRRGCHQLGPLVLESGDVFGLFKRCHVDPRRDFVTVTPHYQLIEEFEVGRLRRLGELGGQRSVFEDPSRVRTVREYQRGDPQSRIHWRTSARLGSRLGDETGGGQLFYTKVFDPVTELGATIMLDFHRNTWRGLPDALPELPASEMAVEIAATIARYLCDGGWKVGLFSNGRDPLGLPGVTMAEARATETLGEALEAARRGRPDDRLQPVSVRARSSTDQFTVIHENLGRLALSDGLAIEELIWVELPYIEREQSLVVITGQVENKLIGALLRVRALGYRIMVMVVCNSVAHDVAFEAFVPAGIEVFRMNEAWRLQEVALGRWSF